MKGDVGPQANESPVIQPKQTDGFTLDESLQGRHVKTDDHSHTCRHLWAFGERGNPESPGIDYDSEHINRVL